MTLTPYMRIGPAAHALGIAALTITSLSSARALDPLTGLARVIPWVNLTVTGNGGRSQLAAGPKTASPPLPQTGNFAARVDMAFHDEFAIRGGQIV